MTKMEILTEIANSKMVETFAKNIAKQGMDANLKDCCQMVYLTLCEYSEDKLVDLWEHHQITFFVARIIANQWASRTSQYYSIYRRYNKYIVSVGSGPELGENIIEKVKAYGK